MKNNNKIHFGERIEGVRIGLAYNFDDRTDAIWLDVYIENNGNDTLYFASTHFLKNFAIEISDSNGNNFNMNEKGQKELETILKSEFYSRVSIEIKPREVRYINSSLNLNEWYDFNNSEKYRVVAKLKEGLTNSVYPISGELHIDL